MALRGWCSTTASWSTRTDGVGAPRLRAAARTCGIDEIQQRRVVTPGFADIEAVAGTVDPGRAAVGDQRRGLVPGEGNRHRSVGRAVNDQGRNPELGELRSKVGV